MDTIFMNSKNSGTFDPHRLLLNLTDKINLQRSDKYVASSNLSIYYSWKNIKKSYIYDKFKISCSVSDIQDYFEYIFKKHGEKTDNPSLRIYVNKIEKRIMSKINTRYYLELLMPKTMKLLGSTKSKITKYENHLEINEVVLVYCDITNNNYQQDLRDWYTFVPHKSFGQLLDISPKNFISLNNFDSEFSYIEVWLTDQNFKPLKYW